MWVSSARFLLIDLIALSFFISLHLSFLMLPHFVSFRPIPFCSFHFEKFGLSSDLNFCCERQSHQNHGFSLSAHNSVFTVDSQSANMDGVFCKLSHDSLSLSGESITILN
jgi:hypothetical protein